MEDYDVEKDDDSFPLTSAISKPSADHLPLSCSAVPLLGSAALPSGSTELTSGPVALPSGSSSLPSATLPSASASLSYRSPGLPYRSAALLAGSPALPFRSPALPSASAIPSHPAALPSATPALPSDPVTLPSGSAALLSGTRPYTKKLKAKPKCCLEEVVRQIAASQEAHRTRRSYFDNAIQIFEERFRFGLTDHESMGFITLFADSSSAVQQSQSFTEHQRDIFVQRNKSKM